MYGLETIKGSRSRSLYPSTEGGKCCTPSLHDRLYDRKIFHCLLPLVKWTTFRSITEHNREDTGSTISHSYHVSNNACITITGGAGHRVK